MPSSVGLWARRLRRRNARHGRIASLRCGPGWIARRWAAPRDTACRCRSGARYRREGARLRRAGPERRHGAGRAGQARGGRAVLVHAAGTRPRPALPGRHPVQRRGVRLPGAPGRAGDRLAASCRTSGTPISSSSPAAAPPPSRAISSAVLQIKGQARRRLSPRLPAPQGAVDARARPHRGDAGRHDRRRCRCWGWTARAARRRCRGALATDEVMRRVEAGRPFRVAYREVAAALRRGEMFGRRRAARDHRPPAVDRRSRRPGTRRGAGPRCAARAAGARGSAAGSTRQCERLAGRDGAPP